MFSHNNFLQLTVSDKSPVTLLVAFAGTCILGVFFSVSLMVNGMVLEDKTIFFARNRAGRSGEHPST